MRVLFLRHGRIETPALCGRADSRSRAADEICAGADRHLRVRDPFEALPAVTAVILAAANLSARRFPKNLALKPFQELAP